MELVYIQNELLRMLKHGQVRMQYQIVMDLSGFELQSL